MHGVYYLYLNAKMFYLETVLNINTLNNISRDHNNLESIKNARVYWVLKRQYFEFLRVYNFTNNSKDSARIREVFLLLVYKYLVQTFIYVFALIIIV